MNDTMDHVVWSRNIDRARQDRRSRLFRLYYVLPLAVIAVITAIAVDPPSALGILIIGGGLGLMIGGWVFLLNHNERTNAEIVLRAGALVCGRASVPVAQVVSFSTWASKIRASNPAAGATNGSSVAMGNAVFRLGDGTSVTITWPAMPPGEVDGVRVALDRVLPGRWQPENR